MEELIMSPQSKNARDIFLQAVELPQHEWDSFLDEKCGDDDECGCLDCVEDDSGSRRCASS